jgi:hypothetical protein
LGVRPGHPTAELLPIRRSLLPSPRFLEHLQIEWDGHPERQPAIEHGEISDDTEAAIGAARGAARRLDNADSVDLARRGAADGPPRAADDARERRFARLGSEFLRVVDAAEQGLDARSVAQMLRRDGDAAHYNRSGERTAPGLVETNQRSPLRIDFSTRVGGKKRGRAGSARLRLPTEKRKIERQELANLGSTRRAGCRVAAWIPAHESA